MDTRTIFILLCCVIVGTCGLECLKCTNTEVKSGSSAMRKLFDGKTNPECGSPSVTDNPASVTCDGINEECGLVESTATASTLLGDITFKMQARDCMVPPNVITGPKCYDGNDDVIGAVKGILNLFLTLSFDLTVDGRVCYCTTDLCAAGGCGDGKVGILGYCMEWYHWILAALAAVVAILLLTCCCCCCCCCRSKKSSGGVIHQLQVTRQPQAVVVSTSNGITGMENPGYDQMQQTCVPMTEK